MRCGSSKKSDTQTVFTRLLGPTPFVLVVDERRKNERDVAFDVFTLRVNNLVTGAGQDRGDVTELNAGQVLKNGSDVLGEARHHGIRTEARTVTARHGVFVDEATLGLQIREHKSLQSELSPNMGKWSSVC